MGRSGRRSIATTPCPWQMYCPYYTFDNKPSTFIIGPSEQILIKGNVLHEAQEIMLRCAFVWVFTLVYIWRDKTSVSKIREKGCVFRQITNSFRSKKRRESKRLTSVHLTIKYNLYGSFCGTPSLPLREVFNSSTKCKSWFMLIDCHKGQGTTMCLHKEWIWF